MVVETQPGEGDAEQPKRPLLAGGYIPPARPPHATAVKDTGAPNPNRPGASFNQVPPTTYSKGQSPDNPSASFNQPEAAPPPQDFHQGDVHQNGGVLPRSQVQSATTDETKITDAAMTGFNDIKTAFSDIFTAGYRAGQATKDAATGDKYVPIDQSQAFGVKATTARDFAANTAAYLFPGGAVLHGIGDTKESSAARLFDVGVGSLYFIPGVGELGAGLKGATGIVARGAVGAEISAVGAILNGARGSSILIAAAAGGLLGAGAPFVFKGGDDAGVRIRYTAEDVPITPGSTGSPYDIGLRTSAEFDTTESGAAVRVRSSTAYSDFAQKGGVRGDVDVTKISDYQRPEFGDTTTSRTGASRYVDDLVAQRSAEDYVTAKSFSETASRIEAGQSATGFRDIPGETHESGEEGFTRTKGAPDFSKVGIPRGGKNIGIYDVTDTGERVKVGDVISSQYLAREESGFSSERVYRGRSLPGRFAGASSRFGQRLVLLKDMLTSPDLAQLYASREDGVDVGMSDDELQARLDNFTKAHGGRTTPDEFRYTDKEAKSGGFPTRRGPGARSVVDMAREDHAGYERGAPRTSFREDESGAGTHVSPPDDTFVAGVISRLQGKSALRVGATGRVGTNGLPIGSQRPGRPGNGMPEIPGTPNRPPTTTPRPHVFPTPTVFIVPITGPKTTPPTTTPGTSTQPRLIAAPQARVPEVLARRKDHGGKPKGMAGTPIWLTPPTKGSAKTNDEALYGFRQLKHPVADLLADFKGQKPSADLPRGKKGRRRR